MAKMRTVMAAVPAMEKEGVTKVSGVPGSAIDPLCTDDLANGNADVLPVVSMLD